MHTDPSTGDAVRAVLDRLAAVYVSRDSGELRSVFAPDPDIVMFSPGAERVDRHGERFPVRVLGIRHARERAGLGQVRRHDRREREEPADQHLDGVVLEKLGTRGRDHHRVDDERGRMRAEELGQDMVRGDIARPLALQGPVLHDRQGVVRIAGVSQGEPGPGVHEDHDAGGSRRLVP